MVLKNKTSPFTVAEYVIPKIGKLPDSLPESIENFKRAIVLQTQGESVELSEETPLIESILAFSAIYSIAREFVLRTKECGLVLVFKHNERNFIRTAPVNEVIFDEVSKLNLFHIETISNENLSIDLPLFWNQAEGKDLIEKTISFVKIISGTLTKADNLDLVGEIPILPMLFAIYLSRPYGEVIRFVDSAQNTINLFQNK